MEKSFGTQKSPEGGFNDVKIRPGISISLSAGGKNK